MPVEGPANPLAGAAVDLERVPTGCARASQAWAKAAGSADCASGQQLGEFAGEQRREGLWSDRAGTASARRFRGPQWRGPGEVDAEAGDDRSPDRSSRMPASLASPSIRSLGHLSAGPRRARRSRPPRSAPGRRQAPGRRGRVAGRSCDQGRADEIALDRLPRRGPAALGRPPAVSATSQSPSTAMHVGEQRGVGRAAAARRSGCGSEQASRGVGRSARRAGRSADSRAARRSAPRPQISAPSSRLWPLAIWPPGRVEIHHLDDLEIIVGADHRAEDADHRQRDRAPRPPRPGTPPTWARSRTAAGCRRG